MDELDVPRRTRLRRLGMYLAVAAAAVFAASVVSVLVHGATPADARAVSGSLSGIAQDGQVLGDAGPVFITEYVDLICRPCADASAIIEDEVLPFVRAGQVVIRRIPLARVANESHGLAYAADAAARQDRMWQFTGLWFARVRGGTARADERGMTRVAADAGLDVERFLADLADQAPRSRAVAQASDLAERDLVQSTPTLIIARGTDENLALVGVQEPGVVASRIREMLAGG